MTGPEILVCRHCGNPIGTGQEVLRNDRLTLEWVHTESRLINCIDPNTWIGTGRVPEGFLNRADPAKESPSEH